jgi:urease accessory protein UreF
LKLLHLCDTLFPIGSFGYSDGLEAAGIQDRDGLRDWIDVCLDETIGRLDAPIVWRAWALVRDASWDALAGLDAESTALRPSAAMRKATRAMGLRLLTTWQALYPDPRGAHALTLAAAGVLGPGLPVAFAAAAVCGDIDRRVAVEAFAYTRLASTASAAMRLMPIEQTETHGLLARALDRVPVVVDALIARDADPEMFTPLVDVAAMRQQYMHSRLFRT